MTATRPRTAVHPDLLAYAYLLTADALLDDMTHTSPRQQQAIPPGDPLRGILARAGSHLAATHPEVADLCRHVAELHPTQEPTP